MNANLSITAGRRYGLLGPNGYESICFKILVKPLPSTKWLIFNEQHSLALGQVIIIIVPHHAKRARTTYFVHF